jgi:hypothetical protein
MVSSRPLSERQLSRLRELGGCDRGVAVIGGSYLDRTYEGLQRRGLVAAEISPLVGFICALTSEGRAVLAESPPQTIEKP